MSEAEWTSERPTVPGWYWVLGSRGTTNIQYFNRYDIRAIATGSWPGGVFAGPLVPPPSPAPPPETGQGWDNRRNRSGREI